MIQSVASSPTPRVSTVQGPTLDKNDFLKLLITQLRHQDPLNPLDQNEFLAQTAQFTSLEQLQNIGGELAGLKSLAAGAGFAQNAALLGKTVSASGRDFVLGDGGALLPFTLDRPAALEVEILDTQGAVVRRLVAGAREAGAQVVEWDGRDNSGRTLTPGTYHFRVLADGGAQALAVQGTLTGLSPAGGQMLYRIGDAVVRQDDLIDVR
jgi:flagellar basal-body rod modification protein FlgD